MMSYNVFVPLFLRLSNNVKENPRPTIFEIINSSNTFYADFSLNLVTVLINSV